MATQLSNITPNTTMSDGDLDKLDRALRSPDFRRLLADYAREVSDPHNRALYEREVAQAELERGFEVTFLHPTPGYVVKTANLRTDEKVFVNVCSDPNVDRPASVKAGGGVRWSVPYMQADPRRDLDKSGRPCAVYDVVFHPEALALAKTGGQRLKQMVTDTALEAVERQFKVKLGRDSLRFPKMAFKGSFKTTVIRRPAKVKGQIENSDDGNTSNNNINNDNNDKKEDDAIREPKYVVKYRQNLLEDLPEAAEQSRRGGRVSDPCRPSHVIVEVNLPDLTSTKEMDLDVTENQLTLTSEQGHSLRVPFNYAVCEDEATAKFDLGARQLTVTVPVRPAEVKRLTSTDSGIDVDTGYFASPEDNADSVKDGCFVTDDNTNLKEEERDLLFPPYSCNIYEDLMIFTMDVRRIDEASVGKSSMPGEAFGFSLRFDSVGKGMVPFRYAFHCAMVVPEEAAVKMPADLDASDRVEVEVWDNNVIVKVALPAGVDFRQYKVGSIAGDLTIHNLPQLRALRKKKEDKMKSASKPDVKPDEAFVEESRDPVKERHSSGDSEDSVLASQDDPAKTEAVSAVPEKPYDPVVILPDGSTLRSILKEKNSSSSIKQRCFSESQAELMSWNSNSEASSRNSVIKEEDEEDESSVRASVLGKKSVRFDKVVQRKVFRPTSSISGLTAKNKKKKDQKRRKADRRASEGDAEDISPQNIENNEIVEEEVDDDPHNDSGLASSMDECCHQDQSGAKKKGNNNNGKKNRRKKQQQKQLLNAASAPSDLIFDLDM